MVDSGEKAVKNEFQFFVLSSCVMLLPFTETKMVEEHWVVGKKIMSSVLNMLDLICQ